ncbi:metallophosphoesterase [Geomonas sp. Red32]|uniref:metallophosphoesterase family protein n=1 Tax=Geomonas sp. Red32 TaxID=2912856 RepID=UPI00202CD4EC|nr:metallophosphoesterase [Geomonas sp. Red32]MCM0081635.1 metallophosphoesterase [Geomonas sp. Red32]
MKSARHLIWSFASILLLVCSVPSLAQDAAPEKPWRFVVLSDTRSDPCAPGGESGVNGAVLGRIARAVASEKPELVLVPGDLVIGNAYKCAPAASFDTQLKNWRKVMSPVYEAGIPVLPVRGNHEYLSRDYFPHDECRPLRPNPEALQIWLRNFGGDVPGNGPEGEKGVTFAYPHKNALFIGLDEQVNYLSYDRSWLDATVKASKRQHLFIFGHFPAFSVMHEDNLSCNTATRDALWDAIGANNGRMYFCGHDHLYDRGEMADAAGRPIRQMLVGNGGAPFYNYSGGYRDSKLKPEKRIISKPGYLVVTIDGRKATAVLKTIDGGKITESDRFDYTLPQ